MERHRCPECRVRRKWQEYKFRLILIRIIVYKPLKTIEYVGILAKLELNEEEKEQAKKDMGAMLDYIDKLNELDTTGVEPMSHVFPVTNVFREDVVTNGDGSEATLSNAPSMKDSGFKVPKTIG